MMKPTDDMLYFMMDISKDPFLSISSKTLSGRLSLAALFLAGMLCINGILSLLIVSYFPLTFLNWTSFKVLTLFGFWGGQLLSIFVRFKLMYAALTCITKLLFRSVGYNLHAPKFRSWRELNAYIIILCCIAKFPLFAASVHLGRVLIISVLMNIVVTIWAFLSQEAQKNLPPLVASGTSTHTLHSPTITQQKEADKRIRKQLAEFFIDPISHSQISDPVFVFNNTRDVHTYSRENVQEIMSLALRQDKNYILEPLTGERISLQPEVGDFKVMCRENVTIKQLLCGLNKGASIEALKLLCTNPETKEIYQSPVFQKLSGVETLRDGIMVGDDPGYVRDVKLSQICDMLRGHRGK
ncbi:MAG: hypothetical protein VXW87_01490 [Pseudomonadota bacterium]|nr:hypothetical protein [Pseudomonadota bacterium]